LPYEILPKTGQGVTAPNHEFLFKLIIVGDSAIGKSCLMHRVCNNEFQDDHEVTVGVEFGSLLVKIQDVYFKMQIWDTAGQESF
jgi:Ras-related protein Rab-2A